jgi:hypothetical protein
MAPKLLRKHAARRLWAGEGECVRRLTILALILGLGVPSLALADTITEEDPEVLFIGTGTGTPCAGGGCPLYGNEVNGIGATLLSIHENGAGQPPLTNPLLLIIGVPNDSSGSAAPDISSVSPLGAGDLGGDKTYYKGSWDTTTGFGGTFTSSSGGSVYSFLGLVFPASPSESFANWSSAEQYVTGITSAGFGIYVYTLNNTGISGGSTIDISFASSLPVGTFVVAYGCSQVASDGSCRPMGKVFGTPFTQSGLVITPEADALALLAFGLVFVGIVLRGRRHSLSV